RSGAPKEELDQKQGRKYSSRRGQYSHLRLLRLHSGNMIAVSAHSGKLPSSKDTEREILRLLPARKQERSSENSSGKNGPLPYVRTTLHQLTEAASRFRALSKHRRTQTSVGV